MITLNIIEFYSINNPCYKKNVNKADSRYTTFQAKGPRGLMLHSVGCPQPSAKVFANGWNKDSAAVAVHAVLQADGTVYHCLPWNYRGWHAGGTANNTHIGVEMTEPSSIWYDSKNGYRLVVKDKASAAAFAAKTYETAVELFASLCKKYNLDPMKDGVIISHKEGSKRGVASNHGDPEHLWTGLGLPYTMDTFRKAVKAVLATPVSNKPATIIKEETEVRYEKLKDITSKYYRPTIDKLITKGIISGKSGTGENMVLDLSEDSVRLLVMLDRAGVFGK